MRGFVAEDGDVAVGMEAVDEAGAWRSLDAETAGACGDAAIWRDGDRGAEAPDVGPPRAAGSWPQRRAAFLLGGLPGGERSHGQFAMAFMGVAVEAEFCQQGVEGFEGGDGFCGAEGGEAVLPVLVAAFDLAIGLRVGSVAEGDAVKVERGAELSERLGNRGEEEAVATRDAEASTFCAERTLHSRRSGNRRRGAGGGRGGERRAGGSRGRRAATRRDRSAHRRGGGCNHRAC